MHVIESQTGLGWEGPSKVIWFQLPCHGQGHLPLDQGAQSPGQPGLEHCQGGGSHNLSGQPVPGPHHPQSEEFTLFQLEAIPTCPVTPCPCKKSLSSLLVGRFRC